MKTSISQTFQDKVVLITGATGFVGQPLVAKILTTIPQVKKVYLLIRSRTNVNGVTVSAEERLSKFFESHVFDQLKSVHGSNFHAWIREKVFAVEGDLSREKLGLSDSDYQQLAAEVQIFINSAAIVEFDSPIDDAVLMNVISAQRSVELAGVCPNAVFVHISTAYSCGSKPGEVAEELHPTYEEIANRLRSNGVDVPLTIQEELEHMLAIGAKIRRDSKLPANDLKNELIEAGLEHAKARGWNDIYTYTKYLGEQIVAKTCENLSVAIIRPSIIESSWQEPVPGWLDGLRMADPLIIGFGKGRLPDFPAKPDIVIDVIPVDLVVNAILAASAKAFYISEIAVYQVASGTINPIQFQSFYRATKTYFHNNPMVDRNGKSIVPKEWKFRDLTSFNRYFEGKYTQIDNSKKWLQKLPFRWSKRKSRELSIIQKSLERLLYYVKIYGAYVRLDYQFEANRTLALYRSLSVEEQRLFNFDASSFNWDDYLQRVHIPGIKRFVLNMESTGINDNDPKPRDVQDQDNVNEKSKIKTRISEHQQFETIPELLSYQTEKVPDKVALQIKRNGQWASYTYRQFDDLSDKIARSLWRNGYRPADRIILFAENQPEWGITYLACAKLGVVIVPIDRQTPVDEVYALLRFTSAKAIFTTSDLIERLEQAKDELTGGIKQIIEIRDIQAECERTEDAVESSIEIPVIEVKPDDITSIIFTSGTAYDPKGVMLSHRSFITNVLAVARQLPPQPEDRFLSVLPLYHALEFTCGFLMSIYSGSTITYLNSLRPNIILEIMKETKTTVMIGVPRLFKMIYDSLQRYVLKIRTDERSLRLTKEQIERIHLSVGQNLRVLVSGGSTLPDSVYDKYLELGIVLYQGYGLTETAPVVSVNPYQKSLRSSVGVLLDGVQIKINQPDANGIGEIIIESPSLMSGYFNNPTATEKILQSSKLYSGDLGYLSDDGYLFLTGRTKDVIVSGAGKNIYPSELEVLYGKHDYIKEICIVGRLANDEIGEEVYAVIVPSKDADESTILEHIRFCANGLPSYQRVHKTHFWPINRVGTTVPDQEQNLPKTQSGRLDRQIIKELIEVYYSQKTKDNQTVITPTDTPLNRIVAELSRIARVPSYQINEDTNLEGDLGLDSLMQVELLLILESELDQILPDNLVTNIKTVGDVVTVINTLQSSKDPLASPTKVNPHQANIQNKTQSKIFRLGMGLIYNQVFSFRVEGLNYIPQNEPCIIAPNHSSHLDTGAIITALGDESERLKVLGARDYFFDTSFKSWFFGTLMNVLPLDRTDNFLQGVRIAQEALSSGCSLLIYPEGTRSITGELQEFRSGLGLLSYEAQVPIIPAYIKGSYQALPKGQNFPRPSSISVSFGSPIRPTANDILKSGNAHQKYRKIASQVRDAIITLQSQAKTDLSNNQ